MSKRATVVSRRVVVNTYEEIGGGQREFDPQQFTVSLQVLSSG